MAWSDQAIRMRKCWHVPALSREADSPSHDITAPTEVHGHAVNNFSQHLDGYKESMAAEQVTSARLTVFESQVRGVLGNLHPLI